MPNLPTPRPTNIILGDLIDDYLSALDASGLAPGVTSLKKGSPILAIFESVAQAESRSSHDILNLLNANDINQVKGERLDRLGQAENVLRRGETYAKGFITVTDTRYTYTGTQIYAGKPAPIPQSTTIYVTDAEDFPASGNIYIGRGTANYEGPIAYSAKTQISDSYWSLTLSTGTLRYHSTTETVTLAQGGNRIIPSGQVVGTPQGNVLSANFYNTTQQAVLEDGEVTLSNIPIIAKKSGLNSNAAAGAIQYVQSPAFSGMTVTNPLPINGGRRIEDDDHYRDRIKTVRANRSRGTIGAIKSHAYGIQSDDESATVTTAELVISPSIGPILYIDDGSGYEEQESSIDSEVLIYSATGGETIFSLSYTPIAKASLRSTLAAPYRLSDGALLALTVGEIYSEHNFVDNDFNDITNATAYEVVGSVNKNPNINFNARTFENGTKVAFFSRNETNEDLVVSTPSDEDLDTSSVFGLTSQHINTLELYKNDQKLYKDGLVAKLWTQNQSLWSGFASGETLTINVDGTGYRTYVIEDADFAAEGSGYSTVREVNSLESWANVLNAKVTGVTFAVEGGKLRLSSNRGASDSASIDIYGASTLVTKGMFASTSLSADGHAADYTVNRNLATIELLTPLESGDKLTAATKYTPAYLDSDTYSSTVTLSDDAYMWWVVDGDTEVITTGLNSLMTLTLTDPDYPSPLRRIAATYTVGAATAYPFTSVKIGDFVVFQKDDIFSGDSMGENAMGAWRISNVDQFGSWVETDAIQTPAVLGTVTNVGTAFANIKFVRAESVVQGCVISADSYTAQDIADELESQIRGINTEIIGNCIRVSSNTYNNSNSSLALVAQNSDAEGLGFTPSIVLGEEPHYASQVTTNSEVGTPTIFGTTTISAIISADTFTPTAYTTIGDFLKGSIPMLRWLRTPVTSDNNRFGSNTYSTNSIALYPVNPDDLELNDTPIDSLIEGSRYVHNSAWHLGPESRLTLTIDGDTTARNFDIPIFRRLTPDPTVPYGTTLRFLDVDNQISGVSQPLSGSFGTNFDFSNFVLYSKARGATHASDSTRTVLWRLKDFVNAELFGQVIYVLPSVPADVYSVTIEEPDYNIYIQIPYGTAPTATELVALVNADDTSPITGTVIGTGTGALDSGAISGNPEAVADMLEGILHIESSAYDAPSENYDMALKHTVGGYSPDWGNEEYRLVPTTTQNVVDFLNQTSLTSLTLAGGLVARSTLDGKLQIASSTLGESGKVQITGGTANLLSIPVQSLGTEVDIDTEIANVRVLIDKNDNIASGFCQGMMVSATNTIALPNELEFEDDETTTIAVASEVATITSSGNHAWSFASNPLFGVRHYIEKHGNFACITNADGTGTAVGINGDYLTILDNEGKWFTGSPQTETDRFGAAVIELQDGRVMVIGGSDTLAFADSAVGTITDVVEIYDPADGSWTTADALPTALAWSAAVLLSDGKVLLSGGIESGSPNVSSDKCYIYDPDLDSWSAATVMNTPRSRHTATLMSDGIVVVVGGLDDSDTALDTTEWYDASSDIWYPIGPTMDTAVFNHQTIPLIGDRLLVLGYGTTVQKLTNYQTMNWDTVGSLLVERYLPSCISLSEGRILVIGGLDTNDPTGIGIYTSEIFDSGTSSSSLTGSLSWGRGFGSAKTLEDSCIVFAGGISDDAPTSAVEIYDPTSGLWTWATGSTYPKAGLNNLVLNDNGTYGMFGSCDVASPAVSNEYTETFDLTVSSINASNKGTFRVIAHTANETWIENPNAVSEDVQINMICRTRNSIMPGDNVRISTPKLGSANQTSFTVATIHLNEQDKLYIPGMSDITTTVMGEDIEDFKVYPVIPCRQVMKVTRIIPTTDEDIWAVYLSPGMASWADSDLWTRTFTEAAGTVLSPLDKFGFSTNVAIGKDAYRYNVGLIAAVNRELFGDPKNTVDYPGYVGAGQRLIISASLVRRVRISVAVRVRPGATNVRSRVQNAIAQVINTAGSASIPLNRITAAVGEIGDILSVVLIDPVPSVGNDVIPVQPHETPKILNLDEDIQVSILGD